MSDWVNIKTQKPEDGQKVICFLPDNYQYLPGKTGEQRHEPIIILRYVDAFFKEGSKKFEDHGPHFWLGEGLSNHYFKDVTHWRPLPEFPSE